MSPRPLSPPFSILSLFHLLSSSIFLLLTSPFSSFSFSSPPLSLPFYLLLFIFLLLFSSFSPFFSPSPCLHYYFSYIACFVLSLSDFPVVYFAVFFLFFLSIFFLVYIFCIFTSFISFLFALFSCFLFAFLFFCLCFSTFLYFIHRKINVFRRCFGSREE